MKTLKPSSCAQANTAAVFPEPWGPHRRATGQRPSAIFSCSESELVARLEVCDRLDGGTTKSSSLSLWTRPAAGLEQGGPVDVMLPPATRLSLLCAVALSFHLVIHWYSSWTCAVLPSTSEAFTGW